MASGLFRGPGLLQNEFLTILSNLDFSHQQKVYTFLGLCLQLRSEKELIYTLQELIYTFQNEAVLDDDRVRWLQQKIIQANEDHAAARHANMLYMTDIHQQRVAAERLRAVSTHHIDATPLSSDELTNPCCLRCHHPCHQEAPRLNKKQTKRARKRACSILGLTTE
jgi:hypothetical protein